MHINKNEIAFRKKFHVGDRIRIKHLHGLNDEDTYNVMYESLGKDAYLGQTLTVSHVGVLLNGLPYCLVEEDNGYFCWFESMIIEGNFMPAMKTGGLPKL